MDLFAPARWIGRDQGDGAGDTVHHRAPQFIAIAHIDVERGSSCVELGGDPAPFLASAGLEADGALLIRPDGFIAARWKRAEREAAAELEAALARARGRAGERGRERAA